MAEFIRRHQTAPLQYDLAEPHFQAGFEAWNDAVQAARQLRAAIPRLQRHWTALGEPQPALDDVLAALNKAEALDTTYMKPGGRPTHAWGIIATLYRRHVEAILRTNGFRGASIASDSGPAPKVIASLIQYSMGIDILPETIARDRRNAKRRNNPRDGSE